MSLFFRWKGGKLSSNKKPPHGLTVKQSGNRQFLLSVVTYIIAYLQQLLTSLFVFRANGGTHYHGYMCSLHTIYTWEKQTSWDGCDLRWQPDYHPNGVCTPPLLGSIRRTRCEPTFGQFDKCFRVERSLQIDHRRDVNLLNYADKPPNRQLGCPTNIQVVAWCEADAHFTNDFSIVIQHSFCSHSIYEIVIALKFCACHDSTAVVACAKNLSHQMIKTLIAAKWISLVFGLWVKYHRWNGPAVVAAKSRGSDVTSQVR